MSFSPIYFSIANHNTAERKNPMEKVIAGYCNRITMRVINPVESSASSIEDIEKILKAKDDRMKQLTRQSIEFYLNVEDDRKKVERTISVLETHYKQMISWIPNHAISTYVDSSGNNQLQGWMQPIFICRNTPLINRLDVRKLFEKVTDEMTEAWLIKKILISKAQQAIAALMNMGKIRVYLSIINADRAKDILSSYHIPAIELLTHEHWQELAIKASDYFLPIETVKNISVSVIRQIPAVICKNTHLRHIHSKGQKVSATLKKLELMQNRYLNEETKNAPYTEEQGLLSAIETDTTEPAAFHSTSQINNSHASFFGRRSIEVKVLKSDKAPRICFKVPLTLLPQDENGPTLFTQKRPLPLEPACQISPIPELPQKRLKHSE